MPFILSTETVADLTKDYLDQHDIPTIAYHYLIDGKEYKDDFGETLSIKSFYSAMAKGSITHTSQVSTGEYLDYFRPFLEKGMDVLHVCLSSGLSGSYHSACLIANQLMEEFPKRKIYVLDSLNATIGIGFLVHQLVLKRDSGFNIDELFEYGKQIRYNIGAWFFSGDLTYFIRGGRISKTSGMIGNMLHIEPLMAVNQEGKLVVRKKIRGKKKTMAMTLEMIKKYGSPVMEDVMIANAMCLDDAQMLGEMIQKEYPNVKIHHVDIGTTIGSHTGPGTTACFFLGEDRRKVDADFSN